MKRLKEFALLYRKRLNWSVIPLHSKIKKLISEWKQYQTELPTAIQVTRWWDKYPNANIGVVTGKVSGIVVFDCDSMKALRYMYERGIQRTLMSQTSKRYKRHFYFKYPYSKSETMRHVSSKSDGIIHVKADGGYVIVPPSIHPDGAVYKWVTDYEPAEMDIWQLEYVLPKKKRKKNYYSKFRKSEAFEMMEGVKEGYRDTTAFKLAIYYKKRGFAKFYTENKLIQWNVLKNRPPLKDTEIKKCVRSAYNYG